MAASSTAALRLDGQRSQQAFDCFLRTLAEPGSIHRLPHGVVAPDVPPVVTLALALADVEVMVSVDGDEGHPLATTVAAVTGATIGPIERALLVVLTDPTPELLGRCARGSALEPESGARVAVAVAGIDDGRASRTTSPTGTTVRLSGPGIPGSRTVRLAGVSPELVGALAAANRSFPSGIDTWFVDPTGTVTAIPRSSRCTIVEED